MKIKDHRVGWCTRGARKRRRSTEDKLDIEPAGVEKKNKRLGAFVVVDEKEFSSA
jgi:hypothetical protein